MKPTKKSIVIITNMRSGSHLLLGLLSSNGYNDHGEIFTQVANSIFKKHRREIILSEDKHLKRRTLINDKFIETVQEMFSYNGVCIVHKYQINRKNFSIRDVFPESHLILLKRNIVDCAVSLYIAKQNKEWFSSDENREKFRKIIPIYNFEEIKSIYDDYSTNLVWTDEPDSVVEYEELCKNPQAEMERLGMEINNSPFTVFTQDKFKKQANPLKAEFKEKFLNDLKGIQL